MAEPATESKSQAPIKARWAIAGALWVVAVVAAYFMFIDSDSQAVFNLSAIAGVSLAITATGLLVGRASLKQGKTIIWLNIAFLTIVCILGAMSIGLFLIPAPLALDYAVLWDKI